MAVAGDLVVNLTGNTAGLQRAVQRGRKMIGGFVGAATNTLGRIGLAAQGLKSIVSVLSSSVGTPLQLAANLEQAEVAFTTMLGSASAAKKVLQDLEQFSATTPFQLPDLQASARLLLANKLPAEQLMNTMKVLGDIAAGTGAPLIEITRIFNKMRATGRVSLENLNELMLRNIPIWDILSQQLGVSKDEIRKMASSGKISFEVINKALTALTQKGGLFENMMKKQSGTIAGLWSTLKDNVSLVLQDIGRGFLDAFNLKSGAEAITAIVKRVRGFVSEVQPILKAFFGFVKVQWMQMTAAARAAWDFIANLTGVTFTEIRDAIVNALIVGEFAFQNMGRIADALWLNIKSGAATVFNELVHFFTATLPAAMRHLLSPAKSLFRQLGAAAKAALRGDFAGAGRKLRGINLAPFNAPRRQIGARELQLHRQADAANRQLNRDLAAFLKQRRAEIFGGAGEQGGRAPRPGAPAGQGGALGVATGGSIAGALRGSREANQAIARALRSESNQKAAQRTAKAAEDILREQKALNDFVRNGQAAIDGFPAA